MEFAAHILVVEDDVILRYTLAEWLRTHGYEVLEARSGDEAMTILSSVLITDLVITDIQMPGTVDGYDLAGYIRKQFPALPVIMVSGNPSLQRIYEIGVSEFFYKPYDLDKITTCVAGLLHQTKVATLKSKQVNDE